MMSKFIFVILKTFLFTLLQQVIHPDHGLFKSNDNGETRVTLTNLLPNQQYFLRVDLHLQDVRDERVIMSNLISAITLPPDIPGM